MAEEVSALGQAGEIANDWVSLLERLVNAPRPGTLATYWPEQICAMVAITYEKPEASHWPFNHFS